MSHPVRELAIAFSDAHAETLPKMTGRYRFAEREVKVYVFPQTWESGAHGFDKPGEAGKSEAYTIVLLATLEYVAAVYFAGQLAYGIDLRVKSVLDNFLCALRSREMLSCRAAKELYGESYRDPRFLQRAQRRGHK